MGLGPVYLWIERDGESVRETRVSAVVKPLGRTVVEIEMEMPAQPGDYLMFAGINGWGNKPVESIRDLVVE